MRNRKDGHQKMHGTKKGRRRKRKTSFQISEAKRTGGWIDVFWMPIVL
jgi:hypothetical protein